MTRKVIASEGVQEQRRRERKREKCRRDMFGNVVYACWKSSGMWKLWKILRALAFNLSLTHTHTQSSHVRTANASRCGCMNRCGWALALCNFLPDTELQRSHRPNWNKKIVKGEIIAHFQPENISIHIVSYRNHRRRKDSYFERFRSCCRYPL